jgi:hypothetical protein
MAEPITFSYSTGGEYKDLNIIESITPSPFVITCHYDHNLKTGNAIKIGTSSTTYYIRKLTSKDFSIHATAADASTNQTGVTEAQAAAGKDIFVLVKSSKSNSIKTVENSLIETDGWHGFTTGDKIKFEISSLNKKKTAAVKILNGGDNFTISPTVTISAPSESSSSSVLATAIALIDSNGVIKKIVVTNPGSGYSSAPTISLSNLSFSVKSVAVTNQGSGYITAPLVRFIGGGGSGAEAVVALDGMSGSWHVESITLTKAGTGYSSTPTVKLVGGGVDQLSSLSLINKGSGYTSAPTISFNGGGGAGASATASIQETVQTGTDWQGNPTYGTVTRDYVTSITLTNAGSGYSTPPAVVFSGGGGSNATATVDLAGLNPNGTSATATATISSSTADLQGTSTGTLGTLENELVDEISLNHVYFIRKLSNSTVTIHRSQADATNNVKALDFGTDNVFSQIAITKLINDSEQSASTAPPVINQTTLAHSVLAGSVTLPVENSNGFESGKNIIIDENDCQEETNTILRATTSYLVLTKGLSFPHEKGHNVRLVLANEQT